MANVRKRALPSGLVRWQASYVDAAGNRRAKLFERQSDGKAWLTKVERDLQLGTHVPLSNSATVAEACLAYVDYCRGRMDRGERMTRKVFNLYEGLIRNHILHDATGIGAIKIGQLTKSMIGDFRDRIRGGGATVQITRKVLGTLSRVLDLAISDDQIVVNNARNVTVIGTRDEGTKKVSVPTKEDVRLLLNHAKPDLRTIILFAAATGVRAGELWALRWRHLDLTGKELKVETRVDAYGTEDVTKSAAGMRTIPVSDNLVTEMKAWKLRSPFSKDGDLVFPNGAGHYRSHTNFAHREWPRVFEEIADEARGRDGRPAAPARFKWHNLRHFAISCWIDAGLPPKTIQTLAGHSTLAMTMDRYGHMFKSEDHRKAMDDIAAKLFV